MNKIEAYKAIENARPIRKMFEGNDYDFAVTIVKNSITKQINACFMTGGTISRIFITETQLRNYIETHYQD